MKKFIILVGILSLPFLGRAQWSVNGTTYSFRNKLTINGSQVCGGASLSNFTILIQLTTNKLKVTGSGGLVSNGNGYDIVFTASDGTTKLDHQIDHYTGTTGDYGAWVRIPTLLAGAGNNTDIYMYYGSGTVSTDPSLTTTWDANFKTIYHFQNGNFNDATSNAINSTNNGTTNLAGALIGDARVFNGTTQYIQSSSTELKTDNNFTVSAWFKANATTASHILWQGESTTSLNGWGSNTTSGESEMNLSLGDCCDVAGGVTLPNKASWFLGDREEEADANIMDVNTAFTDITSWHHIVGTISNMSGGPTATLYLDGALIGTNSGIAEAAGSATDRSTWATSLLIGKPIANSRYFNGDIDEVRISNIARPANWICTEFNNQNSTGTFYNFANRPPDLNGIEGTAINYTEGNAATIITSTTTASDWDDANLSSATVQITANYLNTEDVLAFSNTAAITGLWNSVTGTMTLTGATTLANYQAALRAVTYQNTNNNNPSASTRTVSFIVNDGALNSNTVTRDIGVTPVNDAPVLAAIEGAAVTYTEGQIATAITTTTTTADVDNANLSSATVQITANYLNTEDVLAFSNTAAITGLWNSVTGTMTLTGATTLANYQAALRAVTYQNTNNNNPSASTRTVSFIVNDGALNSNTVTRDIGVTPVNDAPVLAAIEGAAVTYTEGQIATAITTTTTTADVDNANLSSATVQITANYLNTEDVLAFSNTAAITGTWNSVTGTMTLTGVTTLANYQAALRAVTYQNTNNNNPSASTRTVSFIVNDGALNSNTVTRNIGVTPVNDAPVLAAIEGAAVTYTEGQIATAITTTTTTADVDNANLSSATVQITANYLNTEDVLAFSNTAAITGLWNSVTGTMTLTGATTLANYQAALRAVTYQNTNNNNPSASTRTVSFIVNDGALNSNTVTRDIGVTPVNDAPVLAAIEGAAVTYTEGQIATAITTTTTTADVDNANLSSATVQITTNYLNTEDVLAFSNTAAITGTWNAVTGTMTLTGVTTLANYQAALRAVTYQNTNNNNPSASTRTVSFIVNDGALNSNTVTRDIGVTPVNDAPVLAAIEGAAVTYTEGQIATAITTTTTTADVDNANLSSATVQITANYLNTEDVLAFTNTAAITGLWNSVTGTMTLTGATTLANYQAALRAVTYQNTNNNNPSASTRTVSFIVNDGALNSNTVTRDIGVTPVNDAPVLAAIEGAAVTYTEGQIATAITTTTTTADVDNANLSSATVQITANYLNTEDVLAFSNTAAITGLWNSVTGTMTLTGVTTLANYQAALRAVTYQNTNNNNPSASTRTVSFIVNDGALNSNTVTRDIGVTPVNDAPVLAAIEGAAVTYTEGQIATAITTTTTTADVDNANLSSATVQITANYLNTEDVLAFSNTAAITGTWNSVTGTMTLTGVTTLANYQAALRAVTYQNTNNNNPSASTRTVSFIVNDGALNSNTVTRDIGVTPVNDAPVLAAIEGAAVTYTEGQIATAITTTTTTADVDNANLSSATVQITTNYLNTEDVLAFSNTAAITGTWNSVTGTMTLTGVTTLANYQAALRAVTYQNTNNNNPSASTRTVSFIVNDGALNSNTVTRNIGVTPVNDAPVLAAIEGTAVTYTEGQIATAITTTTTTADVDNANLSSATVQITANYLNTEDVLAFSNTAAITGTWNSVTGTMTLTGVTTLANYQAALRAVTYQNTNNNNPSASTRTVSFIVNDGALNSNTVTRDIGVTPVNDAPVLAAIEGAAVTYTEGQIATAITTTTTTADVDNANLSSATVQITANYLNTEDVLAFSNTAAITGTWNSVTGTMTLTGVTTLANYQAALRAVTYQNTNNNNPSASTRTVSFIVNDGALNSNTVTRDIGVTPVNDAPVLAAIEGAAVTYTEGQIATAITTTTTTADVDNANLSSATVQITANYLNTEDVLAFSNTAAITGLWNSVTGTMTLTGVTTLANYQAALRAVTYQNTNNNNPSASTRTVSFIVNDGALNSNTVTRDIGVTPVNDAPVLAAIEGAAVTYTEGQIATAITTTTTTADVDNANLSSATVQITANYLNTEDVLAFSNTAAITGTWNSVTGTMTLTGVTTLANYQAALRAVTYQNTNNNNPSASTRTVSFIVNDGALNSNTVTRDIGVTPVNDAPVLAAIEGTAVTYTEGQIATAITTTTTTADVDNANLSSATVQITANYLNTEDVLAFSNTAAITGLWNSVTGTMTLTGATTLANYQAALRAVTYQNTNNNNPSASTRTVSFIVNDGALNSNTVTRDIGVTPVNDAPVLAAIEGAAVTYTEGQIATAITTTTTTADVDNANLSSATVQITANYLNTEDVLAFSNTAAITGLWNSVTGTMTLTGATTLANYQAALRAVTYQNTNNNNPSASTRTVSFIVNDGALNSNTVTRDIGVTPVNDAPVLAAIEGAAVTYTEGQIATAITTTTTTADVDNANLSSATVQITANYLNTEDVLAFSNTAAITGLWNSVTGTMTLTGVTTLANYQAALRAVTYQNTNNNNPSASTRTVSFIVNDGALNSNTVTRNIGVTPVNDAPVLAAIEGAAVTYTEGQIATAITTTTTTADVDNANLSSATVQITANYLNTEDVLAFSNTAAITGLWNSVTGTMTLTGATTLANYQAALRAVTYQNTNNNNPSASTRTVSFIVNDGALNSNTVTRDIGVTPVNDAPVLAAIEGAAVTYTEGQIATAITTTTTTADVDNANLSSATVQITANYLNTEDVLAFSNTAAITGLWNSVTGTMTLTGATTLANYQAALRAVTYQNTNNNNPSASTRTVSFIVNDGALNSNTVTRDIGVTPVNDAPVLAAIEGAAVTYTEGQIATAITTTTTTADVDNANLSSATVQITANYLNTEDVLAFSNTAAITGLWNSVTGTMTLTGVTTLANYQAALRAVTYQNTNNNNPSASTRTVSFIVNDGALNSNTVTRDIGVTPVNDAPVLAAIEGAAVTYTEGQIATAITTTTTTADVDNANLSSATVQITTNYLNTEDVLAFSNTAAITGTWNAVTGTMTLTGATTLANYQAALRAVTYQNTNNNNPSASTRTVSFIVNDGALNSNTVTRDIDVTPVDSAPVLAAIEAATVTYTEGQAAIAITATTADVDVDNSTLAGATIQITANYISAEDVLAFANTAAITGSWNAVTGTMTLTGTTTLANYQAAIRAVTYLNTSSNPSVLVRTVSLTANDGALNSNTVTRNIGVTPVNDAPVLAAIEGAALTYTEGQIATAITATTTTADVDNTNLASAIIQITSNYINTEDVLAFANTAVITGSWNAGTGTLTLTGVTSLANYQAALQAVAYQNTNNNNPSASTRTVSFIVNDGALNSNTVTRNINVTLVNNAPVATDDNYITNEDTNININVLTNDTDVDNAIDPATLTIVTPALNGTTTINPTTGVVTYAPNMNYNGSDSFTYTVKDVSAATSNTATVNINITPVNDAPVAKDDAVTTLQDVSLVINVLSNDSDVDNALDPASVVVVSNILHGTLTVNSGTGAVTFVPVTGYSGSDSFTYTIQDAGGLVSNIATVTILVTAPNKAPIAVDDGIIIDNTKPLIIDVLANDSDPDGPVSDLTIVSVSSATWGSVTIENGTIVYQAYKNVSSIDSFTYIIQDATGLTDTAVVTIRYQYMELQVSQGFSPNGDSNNDTWYIKSIENYPNNSVKVFDRWGMMVYEARSYTNAQGWDGHANTGQHSGKMLEVDTYYYVLNLGDKNLSGFLTLVR